jgi:hypothetical protein
MRTIRRGFAGVLPVVAAVALLSACTANVVLNRRPGAETGVEGTLQRCAAGEKVCTSDPNQDTSRFNAEHTAFFSLPDCPFGIARILVQNSGSSDAVAIVQCAARPQAPPSSDGGIPTISATDRASSTASLRPAEPAGARGAGSPPGS